MAIIQSGATADLLTVDPTSKAARVTLYRTDGSPEEQAFLGEYYVAVNIPVFTAALAANSGLVAIRNGATRRMKFLLGELTLGFTGTAAASAMQVSVRRFTAATPTGGTAFTIVPEDSAMSASTVADSRYCAAGTALTITGLVVGAPIYVAQLSRSLTGNTVNFELNRDIVLNVNEGLIIQYDTVGVIGDALGATFYWGEYV